MKQKLLIFGALFFLILLLIGLNAVSYVKKDKKPDDEFKPNRSSYNAGSTGTRAFYDLLAETGRKVVRWERPASELWENRTAKNAPETFVMIGGIRATSDAELKKLLEWVDRGGKLVVIDRRPQNDLLTTTADWHLSIKAEENPPYEYIDPFDTALMTKNVVAAQPAQPTVYTKGVNSIQPSRFSASLLFERYKNTEPSSKESSKDKPVTGTGIGRGESGQTMPPPAPARTPIKTEPGEYDEEDFENLEEFSVNSNSSNANSSNANSAKQTGTRKPPPKSPEYFPTPTPKIQTVPISGDTASEQLGPIVHLANDRKNLVVEVPFGEGQIVYLADDYIVSNAGIRLVDNAQLGLNLVASRPGLIAFDEYRHGYGTNNNRLLEYFAETPVAAIIGQIVLLIFLIFLAQSRRFARAVSIPEPNRLSKLEYVAAIAELQRRTKAFDLAIENIYTDFRRRAGRAVGLDAQQSSPEELARLVGERIGENEFEIYKLLKTCEDVMHGAPTNKKQVVALAADLRELEEKLGLKRNRRAKI